jgi:polygalacturonase
MRMQRLAAVSLLFFGAAIAAHSQDTRTVTEPKIPTSCTVLRAEKFAYTEKLSDWYEKTTDTARIQDALDHCKPGHAVQLAESATGSNAFLAGSLELREGVTLLIDKGVTLFASRDPKDFDSDPNGSTPLLCGTWKPDVSRAYVTAKDPNAATIAPSKAIPPPVMGRGCKPLISINVKNAAIMGEGTIDGRGGSQVIGHDYTWWQMARMAEPKQSPYYSGRLITASHADGLIVYGVHLNNAWNCHLCVQGTNGFTAWGVHLQTPTVKGTDARNTDGIDPGSSTNVTVAYSWIDNGDDNIAVKANVQHMSVLHNHFYDGHGMSVGSEVVNDSFLYVDDLTEDHTTSGVRVKSNNAKGGAAHDFTFRNICMRNVQVPIAISPYYNNGTTEDFTDPGVIGDRIPDYKAMHLENITDLTPGPVLIAGKNADHITEATLTNVTIKGITPDQVHVNYANLKVAGSNIPFADAAKGNATVNVAAAGGNAKPYACEGKFAPYQ